MYTEFLEHLTFFMDKEDIKINEPMKKHTSFRVGGPAKVFLTVHSEEVLAKIMVALKERKLPYFVLGNGSNLLVSDQGYDGVMIYLGEEFASVEVQGNKIKAGAAAFLGKVARKALEEELTGLEFAAGIPGSLGGGAVMNAGAYGGELSQVVTRIRAMDQLGNIVLLEKEEFAMGYRTSVFKTKPYVILEVEMELEKGNPTEILGKMNEYTKARIEKQPLEYPSAGSTFKRPEGYFAGKLIMDAGLRGFSVGDAQVSEKHCGFVINKGNATASEIRTLMDEVVKKVKEQFGVELEPEVILLGD
ncbi:MAG: UDP-N-acetylmuramate dehydrogenase [Lachnospiraceae bacterium]|nr:UDP-N-acetylmuramate dehydrogenase [Lachnospiraceae bacterium]